MSIEKIINDIKKHYLKHQVLFFVIILGIVVLGFAIQLYLFYHERMYESDISLDAINWTDECTGKIYTIQEKNDFCNQCYNNKSFSCKWPLDMNLTIDRVRTVISTGGEVHCYFIIDNINYYTEKGSFYGLTDPKLFTWQVLLADVDHDIKFCCGIDRQSTVATIFSLQKNIEQACISRHVIKRCGPEYASANVS